ncbi:unnamed protein product, partial [Allacma fusca]
FERKNGFKGNERTIDVFVVLKVWKQFAITSDCYPAGQIST